ncbi:unnamed protein product [Auanema sp. JU1783]|nr:unnamed protein product [Auanema sp. JU1783]
MSFSELQKPANRKLLYILGGIFIFSLIILITGIVLIAVGSHKLSVKKNCPLPTVPVLNASTISATSWDPTIPWNEQYLNISSRPYSSLKSRLQAESLAILSSMRMSPMPIAAIVEGFQPSPINGTVFYTTYIFTVATPPTSSLQKHLDQRWKTYTNTDTLSQCSSVFIPDFNNPLPPTYSPATGNTGKPTPPLPVGAFCDANQNNVQTTFLVDVARPSYGTLDDKLTKIRNYLSAYDEAIGLHSTQWKSTQFDLIVYNGLGATSIGTCTSDDCWHKTVAQLNSTNVNPTFNDYHTLNNGLTYISNILSMPIIGQGKSIIIISDGYDITNDPPNVLAADLKAHGFYIGAVVGTVNEVARKTFQSIVSADSFYYPIDDFTWLNNRGVLASSAQWTCDAYYATSPAPTKPSTRIPLITTQAPVTPKPVYTTPSPNAPVPRCPVDVLFLVDDSSLMSVSTGFKNSLVFTLTTSNIIQQAHNDSRFGFISFNNAVVFSTSDYLPRDKFVAALNSLTSKPSYTRLSVGFAAAEKFVSQKARYDQHGVRSLMYFLSSGTNSNDSEVYDSQKHSHNLRTQYETQIIALGIDENLYESYLTENAIDYYTRDGSIGSSFMNVSSTNVGNNSTIGPALNLIQCKEVGCSTNLYFAMEVSSIEGRDMVEIQRETIENLIAIYSDKFYTTGGKLTLVYYSYPDNTGTLFAMNDNPTDAVNQLNTTSFQPFGSGSNIVFGLNELLDVLDLDQSGNNKVVVLFGRGASDPSMDPSPLGQLLRSKATVQGVVLGKYPDQSTMEKITGRKAIDGNSLIFTNALGQVNVTTSSSQLTVQLYTAINGFFAKPVCQPVPTLNKVCDQFDDVNIILHGSDRSTWDTIKTFAANYVISSLYGGLNDNQINEGSPVNLAVITYFGSNVTPVLAMDAVKTSQGIYDTIMSLPYQNVTSTITNLLSRSYRQAHQQMEIGRSVASKTLLVITDTVDFADYQSALNERGRLPYSYVYGIKVNGKSGDIIPGQNDGISVSNAQSLSMDNPRTAVVLANQVYNALCRVYEQPIIPPSTTPTAPSTPAPIPPVKVRDIWPDITILIDVSNQSFVSFQQTKLFLQTTFRDQFYIGANGSRFTVATFDNSATNVICTFSDVVNYWSLYECLGSRLSYLSVSADNTRDIDQALTYLNTNVYSSIAKSSFEPLKENYMYVFSLGSSSTDFSKSVATIRQQQVRTIAVDLTKTMTASELSRFGPDSYAITNWQSDEVRAALSSVILAQATTRPAPAINSFYSNFYFVVDQSLEIINDIQNVRTFVKNFVNLLTVNDHRSSVSIIPFADSVSNNHLDLTSNSDTVQTFLSSWIATPSGKSNIGSAISAVDKNIKKITNSRQNYVIFLVGANQTNNPDVSSLLADNAILYVLDYNNRINYADLLTGDSSSIFRVDGSASLDDWSEGKFPVPLRGRNPMNVFFNNLFDDQLAYDSTNFPSDEIAADVLIFLDETGMSDSDFAYMKQFLINFVDKFTISNRDTQFALQAFNGQNIPEAGFHLWESKSNQAIKDKISNLHLEQNPTTAASDLTGAINQGLSFFLDPKNGWREGATTYSLLFTNSNNFYQNSKQTAQALKITDTTKVYGVSTNGERPTFVTQFINTGFQQTVSSPQFLKAESGVGLNLLSAITSEYKEQVYPSLPPLRTINADHIFLVDNSGLSPLQLSQIKVFLKTFIQDVGDFSTGDASRLSVVNYNSQGVVLPTSWPLSSYSSVDQLNNAIDAIYASSTDLPPDLNAAIQYFAFDPESAGLNVNRTVFVTAFLQSSNISSPIPALTTKTINLKYFTYALQLGVTSPLPYLNQFLGTSYDDAYSVISDPSQYKTVSSVNNPFNSFNTYMQSEYVAYQRTYGVY